MTTAQEQEQRLEQLLEAQRDIVDRLGHGAALRDVLDELVRLIERQLGDGSAATVLLLDDDGKHLVHGAAPHMPADYVAAIDGGAIGPRAGSCGTAAYRGLPVIVSDIAADPLWNDYRDVAQAAGLHACWSIPIQSGDGRVLGTFAIYPPAPGMPDEPARALLEAFVGTAAVAIELERSRDVAGA